MRMNILSGKGWVLFGGSSHVLRQDVAHAEASQGLPIAIPEDRLVAPAVDLVGLKEALQPDDRIGPERADALLSTLAMQNDMSRGRQLKIHSPYVEHLLHPGAGVVQKTQESIIAATLCALWKYACQDGVHLLDHEVVDRLTVGAFQWDPKDLRAQIDQLRRAERNEPEEGANRGEAMISCRRRVRPDGLE